MQRVANEFVIVLKQLFTIQMVGLLIKLPKLFLFTKQQLLDTSMSTLLRVN